MTETELLAVLNMSEDEQWKKMRPFIDADGDTYERGVYSNCLRRQVFADLAFRLRDEADLPKMHDAMFLIQEKMKMTRYACAFWGLYHTKPIIWIIAALIAKENDK
jgi:hypothetical protein